MCERVHVCVCLHVHVCTKQCVSYGVMTYGPVNCTDMSRGTASSSSISNFPLASRLAGWGMLKGWGFMWVKAWVHHTSPSLGM